MNKFALIKARTSILSQFVFKMESVIRVGKILGRETDYGINDEE
jgi:hypothetical protein